MASFPAHVPPLRNAPPAPGEITPRAIGSRSSPIWPSVVSRLSTKSRDRVSARSSASRMSAR